MEVLDSLASEEPLISGVNDKSALAGVPFYKMTGSGNDFVCFDSRHAPLQLLTSPEIVRSICNRHNGIGADGLVVLEPQSGVADVKIHFYNADGTAADLCGNATLCSTALSALLHLAPAEGMRLLTGAGIIRSRADASQPEIELQPVSEIRPDMPIALEDGEQRIGFAVAGIPHLVLLCKDADAIALAARGPALRWHSALGPSGANVNWVSAIPGGGWRYRTFERGVEGETLACGTGAVATAVLLSQWGLATGRTVTIRTTSGRDLEVNLAPVDGAKEAFRPTLRGEGRVVFVGQIDTL